ncbi:MAG: ComF family protein [Salinisphaera sp.]|jgi:ComF family protein|nr:ComF family protein [Salinisphaera sp.]
MKYFFDQWIKSAQYALLGPRCLLCQAPSTLSRALCDGCWGDLPHMQRQCVHCALPLGDVQTGDCCPVCAKAPIFDAAIAACGYIQPMPWLITGLKFRGRMSHAPLLADLLATRIESLNPPLADVLLPVPLHPRSYRRRGFNQAERIAQRLGRRLQRPVATDWVRRIRDTQPQSQLTAAQRRANVHRAFAADPVADGRHVAIIDDVVTTTRTAAAMAQALRRAGASRIDLYCVARA